MSDVSTRELRLELVIHYESPWRYLRQGLAGSPAGQGSYLSPTHECSRSLSEQRLSCAMLRSNVDLL